MEKKLKNQSQDLRESLDIQLLITCSVMWLLPLSNQCSLPTAEFRQRSLLNKNIWECGCHQQSGHDVPGIFVHYHARLKP